MCGNVYVIRLASKPQGCELAEGLRIPLQPKYLPRKHRPNDGFSYFPQKFVSNCHPVFPSRCARIYQKAHLVFTPIFK